MSLNTSTPFRKNQIMPIGCYSLVPYVAHHVAIHRPERVLDLGIGLGSYGSVVRQWGDLGERPWRTYLIGVEAWAGYRNPMWDLYNAVAACSIQEFLSEQSGQFDLVLLTDVIEHFERHEGQAIVEQLKQEIVAPGGSLFVGTPGIFCEQGAVGGNEWERHRSLWLASDFAGQGFRVILDGNPDAFGNQMVLAEWKNLRP